MEGRTGPALTLYFPLRASGSRQLEGARTELEISTGVFPQSPSMSHILLGDYPSITHFFLLGCFLEQRQRAFLVEIQAHASRSQLSDPDELVELFLSEMNIVVEVLGYQKCLEPEMPLIPSLRRTGSVVFKKRAEVWDLLRRGALLHPGHTRDPSTLLSRNGPEFTIRTWWSTPRSLTTPKKLMEEFDWAVNGLLRLRAGLAHEDSAKLKDELHKVWEDLRSQTNRLGALREGYSRLMVNAQAQLSAFDRIAQGASDV
ncbi:hypothetical protein FA13DRAFT_1776341 [Coprinellus micaceus]|uniref:Uncharacterized protein n=1 Tax=Coprinellus micaceus TaxID=71717 RepID=A0A4Y7T114_COPMI|nr:hypothetical protein FA13DRAFT_1776341 [Coprinellus micaceus]